MIGIIVPVYNVEQYLRRCIDSILVQSFQDFTIVLVDDGSTDTSPRICDEYKGKHEKIEVIHKKNGGLSEARNYGLDYVFRQPTIDWITFIDSDDWIHPQYLECLYNACLEYETNISAVHFQRTDAIRFEEPYTDYSNIHALVRSPEDYWLMREACPRIACAKLYKKELWKNIRFPLNVIHEDEMIIYLLLFAEKRIAVFELRIYYYYYNPTGIIQSTWSEKKLTKIQAIKNQRRFFKKHNFMLAYANAISFYLYFLNDAVVNLKKKNHYFLSEYYCLKLKLAVIDYLLFNRNLNIKIDDYFTTAFPISAKIIHKFRIPL